VALSHKVVLVTGTSSGIGQATATHLRDRGWRVLAGVRREGAAPAGTEELVFDVREPPDFGLETLDGVVLNAGTATYAGPLEFLPLDALREQLEVNVVGQLAVLQRVLPALRASRGRIVLMGSVSGVSALPFLGAYAMSKFALEAAADSLRVELAPWGIHVSLIQPGSIRTPMWTRERPDPPPEALALYGERIAALRRAVAARISHQAPPSEVAKAVEHALTSDRPKPRYLVGRDAKLRKRFEALPASVRDRLVARLLFSGAKEPTRPA
jgi:NAD(P)-dependent dehydrogenase (short-subunit alcohol dehydrogenase family)